MSNQQWEIQVFGWEKESAVVVVCENDLQMFVNAIDVVINNDACRYTTVVFETVLFGSDILKMTDVISKLSKSFVWFYHCQTA